jgi:hypothetical protein
MIKVTMNRSAMINCGGGYSISKDSEFELIDNGTMYNNVGQVLEVRDDTKLMANVDKLTVSKAIKAVLPVVELVATMFAPFVRK